MSDATPKSEPLQLNAVLGVGVVGVLLAAGAAVLVGIAAAFGVAAGALLATLNLWAIGLLVRRLFTDEGPVAPWALIAVAKLALLFGAVYLLVFSGLADILPVVVGYGALPIGVVLAQLSTKSPADEEA